MKSVLARGLSVLRGEGVAILVSKTLNATVYRRLVLFGRPLTGAEPLIQSPLELTFSTLDHSRMDDYVESRPGERAESCRTRLDAGDVCALAVHDGRIVAAAWSSTGIAPIDFLDLRLPIPAGVTYRHSTFTAPQYRNKKVGSDLIEWSARWLYDRGNRTIFSAIHAANKASIAYTSAAGSQVLGWIAVLRLGPWRIHWKHIKRGSRAPW